MLFYWYIYLYPWPNLDKPWCCLRQVWMNVQSVLLEELRLPWLEQTTAKFALKAAINQTTVQRLV